MLKSLITYLNLKLDLLNYFDLTRCLVELKNDSEGTRQPVEYISNGNYDVIDWDEFNGVSYWRLRDEITSDRTEERKYKAGARNNIETTVPLKLVFAVPRTKLTEDDAYSFDRIRQTMVKQFAIDDDVIKTTLQAESVRINVVSANSDAKEVWEEETESTGTFEPKYETVFGSIDVDVVIISKHSCLPTECDDVESDIIKAFDWCGNTAVTVGRLTEAQQTCISDFLCSCADATVQINGVEVATPASGGTVDIPVNLDGVPSGSWDGDSWEVTSNPCADATVQLNGVDMADIASGDTENIQVRQSSGSTLVGSKQGQYWRIDDSAISINGSPVADVRAEDSLDIDVTQDGSPVGSWNGSAFIIPSCPSVNGVSLSISNTSPDFGEEINLEATASNFTPDTYIFYVINSIDEIYLIYQGPLNTYNWTVDIPIGNWTVFVDAVESITIHASDSQSIEVIATNLLLDDFPNALFAQGTQQLRLAFTDPIANIRRSSDNRQADFSKSGPQIVEQIDEGSIASNSSPSGSDGDTLFDFVTSNNGFVYALYDQSGTSYDFTQSTAGSQPTIVASGVLNLIGNVSTLSFNGSSSFIEAWRNSFTPSAFQTIYDSISFCCIIKPTNVSGSGSNWYVSKNIISARRQSGTITSPFTFGISNSKIEIGFTDNYIIGSQRFQSTATISAGTTYAVGFSVNGNTVKLYINGSLDSTHTITNPTGNRSLGSENSSLTLGCRTTDAGLPTDYFAGNIAQAVLWPTVLSDADFNNIYTNHQQT